MIRPLSWSVLLALPGLVACREPRPAPVVPASVVPAPAASAAPAAPLARDAPPVQLFLTAEVHNATAPCGCTSDPLGDVARLAGLVRAAGDRGLLLDSGGLLYKDVGAWPAQDQRKARFLWETFGALKAVGTVQPEDLLQGALPAGDGPQLVVSNGAVPALSRAAPEVLRTVGGVRVGVVGVLSPEAPWPPPWSTPGAPAAELSTLVSGRVQSLRAAGAHFIVALTGLSRAPARRLARTVPGLDVVVAGDQVEDGVAEPEQLVSEGGAPGAILVVPAKEAQRVVRVQLYRYPAGAAPGSPRLFTGTNGAQRERERLRQQLKRAQELLADLGARSDADPAFVAATRADVERLQGALAAPPPSVTPPSGPYVTAELLPLNGAVARDAGVVAAQAALDRAIGEDNLKAVTRTPSPPLRGGPAYVGDCLGACHNHEDAVKQWTGTHHAQAWPTLVKAGKALDLDCVACHSVGYGELGGSNLRTLWENDQGQRKPDLRNVGCESCHGPGSLHVRAPVKVAVPVPKPDASRCRVCHTPQHSDTFEEKAYLRDILGPGHGEDARVKLGPGVTGHELREAALKRAAAH